MPENNAGHPPLLPELEMVFAVARPLASSEQLVLQEGIREGVSETLRGFIRDYPGSGIVVRDDLFLVEVDVSAGSIKVVVRFGRAAAMAMLLALAGCQTSRHPTYAELTSRAIVASRDQVHFRMKVEAHISAEESSSSVKLGLIADIDRVLENTRAGKQAPGDAVIELRKLFEQMDRSPDRELLIAALTLYINRQYGEQFFPDLKLRLGDPGSARQAGQRLMAMETHSLFVRLIVHVVKEPAAGSLTPELMRTIVREELARAAEEAEDDWVPVIGAFRKGKYGKASYEIFVLLGTIEGAMGFVQRFRALRRAAEKAGGRIEGEAARHGGKATTEVAPGVEASAQIEKAVANASGTNAPAKAKDVAQKLHSAAARAVNPSVSHELKEQGVALDSSVNVG